jgi:hypothetical protein
VPLRIVQYHTPPVSPVQIISTGVLIHRLAPEELQKPALKWSLLPSPVRYQPQSIAHAPHAPKIISGGLL